MPPTATDAELVRLVRLGDRDAATRLLARHAPLMTAIIRDAVRNFGIHRRRVDDYKAAAQLAFWEAAATLPPKGWDEAGASKYPSYAGRLARYRVMTQIRDEFAREWSNQESEDGESLLDECPTRLPRSVDVSSLLSVLDDRERQAVVAVYGLDGHGGDGHACPSEEKRSRYPLRVLSVAKRLGLEYAELRAVVESGLAKMREAAGVTP